MISTFSIVSEENSIAVLEQRIYEGISNRDCGHSCSNINSFTCHGCNIDVCAECSREFVKNKNNWYCLSCHDTEFNEDENDDNYREDDYYEDRQTFLFYDDEVGEVYEIDEDLRYEPKYYGGRIFDKSKYIDLLFYLNAV